MDHKKEIKTEISISASSKIVWETLMNNEAYEEWNPFIVKSVGKIALGKTIKNTINNGNKTMNFSPQITDLQTLSRFEWLGHLWFKGIFDGRHYFEIEEISAKETKLIHGEKFSGLLSRVILRSIQQETTEGFQKMNLALKRVAEEKQRQNL